MDTIILSNVAEGTHEDNITKYAKLAINTANVLVTLDSSDPDKVQVCTATDKPIGVATDEAQAGEVLNVQLLGCSCTANIIASGSIAAGSLLIPDADGKVRSMPSEAGSYVCVGIALSSVASGGLVEVLTSLPYQYTVSV